MPDLGEAIADNRAAVAEFIAAARQVPAERWNQAPGPKKWTPAQLVEHVRLVYDLSLRVADGTYTGLAFPMWVRNLFRRMFFDRVSRRGYFKTGGRGPKAFDPPATPGSVEQLLPRLQEASEGLEASLTRLGAERRMEVMHPFFGALPLGAYLRFQAIHTRHHAEQLGGKAVRRGGG